MSFANINIGTTAGDGTGDPLRVAFNKINLNFANIASGQITVNAPVLSVAGRTGNIVLTYQDVAGTVSNASLATTLSGNLVVGNVSYTMGNYQNWTQGNVYTVASALDQLAARLKAAGF
jgi:hypothetical protein